MTVPDLTPYWDDDKSWVGFFLLLIPATDLPVPADELHRQVRSRIESDAVLFELTTVALATPAIDSPTFDEDLKASVVSASMQSGHFFAPRGVFAVAVVGDSQREIDRMVERLRKSPFLADLRVQLFTHVVQLDRGGMLAPASASTSSRKAHWVQREILHAQRFGKPILPLLLSGQHFIEVLELQAENVTTERMPGHTYIAQLVSLLRPS